MRTKIKYLILHTMAKVVSLLPTRYIIFESIPDMADNTLCVYNEMNRRGIYKKYQFVWACNEINNAEREVGIKYIDINNKVKRFYYSMRSKCLISCNTILESFGDYQKSIYLTHGFGLKKSGGYVAPDGVDIVVGLSEVANKVIGKELNIPLSKFIVTGYPRNDVFKCSNSKKIEILFELQYSKIIAWYPTFRQHKSHSGHSEAANTLPIIHNAESAMEINKCAKEHNVLIIIKPHFSQDTSYLTDLNLSNIKLINDAFFVEKGITSYGFLRECDALVTDYSSIYFDYLLCDKPIAAVWEDIAEYKKNRGFAVDVDHYMKGAYKVYDYSDFVSFIMEVAESIDSCKESREAIKDEVHFFKDGNSTKRVVDIIEKVLS